MKRRNWIIINILNISLYIDFLLLLNITSYNKNTNNMIKIALILPKNGVVLDLKSGEHLYFLAGPIRGAGDWQSKAIKMLTEKDPACYIVCPCRYVEQNHDLSRYSLPATKLPSETDDIREFPEYMLEFPDQTRWERYYLAKAAHLGSIIFWLPQEDANNPRKKEDGPYARDTYGELGRWSIRHALQHNPFGQEKQVKIVVGAEPTFPGLSVIQKNFDDDHGKPFTIYTTLEDTIDQAITLANQ